MNPEAQGGAASLSRLYPHLQATGAAQLHRLLPVRLITLSLSLAAGRTRHGNRLI